MVNQEPFKFLVYIIVKSPSHSLWSWSLSTWKLSNWLLCCAVFPVALCPLSSHLPSSHTSRFPFWSHLVAGLLAASHWPLPSQGCVRSPCCPPASAPAQLPLPPAWFHNIIILTPIFSKSIFKLLPEIFYTFLLRFLLAHFYLTKFAPISGISSHIYNHYHRDILLKPPKSSGKQRVWG